MTFFQKIKVAILGRRTQNFPQQVHESETDIANNKVQEFLEDRRDQLTAKDVFPDMKVFKPVKTSKNPSLNDIKIRLKNAKKSFPLPAGYKDTCICVRMIIRNKQKEKESYKKELAQLYRFACEYNFFDSSPYLEKAKEPSYNLDEVIKKSEFSALKMPFREIGYKHIPQLNEPDIKWLVSEYGEPENHTTVSEYHRDYFEKAEALLKEKREREKLWKM